MGEIRTQHIVKIYNKHRVVNDVCIEVKQGEIVGLLGPNGAGKTTSFYMIVGLIKPNQGQIFLDEKEITPLPMFQRARRGIGYLAQEASIFRKLSVEENILAILETQPLSREERKEKLDTLLNELSISHLAKRMAYQLSGGERRRVEITRALVTAPRFMLLDEPFAGVDPIAVEDIHEIIYRLREKKMGILITDHNVHETLRITDRSYIISEGRILKSGTAEVLANDPEVRKVYLGENFRLMKGPVL